MKQEFIGFVCGVSIGAKDVMLNVMLNFIWRSKSQRNFYSGKLLYASSF